MFFERDVVGFYAWRWVSFGSVSGFGRDGDGGARRLTFGFLEDAFDGTAAAAAGHADVEVVFVFGHLDYLMVDVRCLWGVFVLEMLALSASRYAVVRGAAVTNRVMGGWGVQENILDVFWLLTRNNAETMLI